MEISIDRRGEGTGALKISVGVRSLDTATHSSLGAADKAAISTVLSKAARDVEAIVTGLDNATTRPIQPAG